MTCYDDLPPEIVKKILCDRALLCADRYRRDLSPSDRRTILSLCEELRQLEAQLSDVRMELEGVDYEGGDLQRIYDDVVTHDMDFEDVFEEEEDDEDGDRRVHADLVFELVCLEKRVDHVTTRLTDKLYEVGVVANDFTRRARRYWSDTGVPT